MVITFIIVLIMIYDKITGYKAPAVKITVAVDSDEYLKKYMPKA